MLIRCKFRVLSITSSWDNSTLVSMRPCTAKDLSIDENGQRVRRDNPENEQFWKYTPSGEASLGFPKGKPLPDWVKEGAYVYIDIDTTLEIGERWDVSLWLHASGGVEVDLHTHRDKIKFGLSEEHSRPVAQAIISIFALGHIAAMQNPDMSVQWGVSFVPALESQAVPE